MLERIWNFKTKTLLVVILLAVLGGFMVGVVYHDMTAEPMTSPINYFSTESECTNVTHEPCGYKLVKAYSVK